MKVRTVLAVSVVAAACGSQPAAPVTSNPEPVPTVQLPAVSPRELLRESIKSGDGKEARPGDVVRVHYVGTFLNGRTFESSRSRGEPFRFQLGAGRVMRGWEEGIVGMKAGEVRKLTIPPALAYGESTVGAIPPNSTLVFEIELVDVGG